MPLLAPSRPKVWLRPCIHAKIHFKNTTVVLRRIHISPAHPRPRPGAYRKLQIKVILICNAILTLPLCRCESECSYDQTLEMNYGTCLYCRNFIARASHSHFPKNSSLELWMPKFTIPMNRHCLLYTYTDINIDSHNRFC